MKGQVVKFIPNLGICIIMHLISQHNRLKITVTIALLKLINIFHYRCYNTYNILNNQNIYTLNIKIWIL